MNETLSSAYQYYQKGDLERAENICKKIFETNPNVPDVLFFLGILYYDLARYDLAIDYFKKALLLSPTSPDIQYNLANAYRKAGLFDEAVTHYSDAIQLNPDLYEAYHNLGIITMEQRLIDQAVEYFQRALELNPDFYNSYFFLGILLQGKGQIDKAVACFKRTVQMNPADYEAFCKLGTAFQEKGQLEEATDCYKNAIRINPNFAGAYKDMGITLMEQGKNEEAMAAFNNALDLEPNCFGTRLAKCMARLQIIYPDENSVNISRKFYREELLKLKDDISFGVFQCIEAAAEAVGTVHPFYLAYQGLNDCDLQTIYGNLICKVMACRYPQFALRPTLPPRIYDEPLRIGIASRFFYRHSVWKIPIKGWIENLDRKRFSLYGYYTGRKKDDETAVARSYFVKFVEDVYSFEQLCNTIRGDNLHVLIYPEIGMDQMTVKLAALRLAPVQCTSLGHPDTTGFPTIDYYLSSDLMEPPDADNHYSEILIRLPKLSFPYRPLEVPNIAITRASLGLPKEAILYLCSQSLFKYLPQYDEIFPRIASNISMCKFLFISNSSRHVTEQFRQRIKQIFEKWKLTADDYVVFLPRLDAGQYHGINLLADIFLDSLGWSGNNTTFEAIACNLPIVTFPGKLMRACHCSAILRMMGLTETIANTIDEYINIATKLGNDPDFRDHIREKILERKHIIYQDRECINALEHFLEQVTDKKM